MPAGTHAVTLVARSLLTLLDTISDPEAPAAIVAFAVSLVSCLAKQMAGVADAVVSGGIVETLTMHLRRDHEQVSAETDCQTTRESENSAH